MYNPNEIEAVVTVQYRTPDGVVHETLEKALEHTAIYRPVYRMFASNRDEGVFETTDVTQATFIYCPDSCSVEDFVNDGENKGYTVDGIYDEGWYVWDADDYVWVRMPEGTISLFENFLL